MANVLPKDKQIQIISALAEGSSLRSLTRVTGIHRSTIAGLALRVGEGCAKLMDTKMRDLTCNFLQFDEVWGFIGKKQKNLTVDDDPTKGDVWTWCAIDAETKLVPAFRVGKRDSQTANAFVSDVASRLKNRPQISTDGLRAYVEAVENAFGMDVDYGMIIKNYGADKGEHHQERRYSAPEIVFTEKRHVVGRPDMDLVSTSYVERLNATTRLHVKRLSRLTHAFSKKIEHFEAAVALHFAYYNFCRTHGSLKMTPAMMAGIEKNWWTVGDLVEAAL
jgi:IS1 family transposase